MRTQPIRRAGLGFESRCAPAFSEGEKGLTGMAVRNRRAPGCSSAPDLRSRRPSSARPARPAPGPGASRPPGTVLPTWDPWSPGRASGTVYERFSVNVAVATLCAFLVASVTRTEIEYFPDAIFVLGVPDRRPVELSLRPFGRAESFFHL